MDHDQALRPAGPENLYPVITMLEINASSQGSPAILSPVPPSNSQTDGTLHVRLPVRIKDAPQILNQEIDVPSTKRSNQQDICAFLVQWISLKFLDNLHFPKSERRMYSKCVKKGPVSGSRVLMWMERIRPSFQTMCIFGKGSLGHLYYWDLSENVLLDALVHSQAQVQNIMKDLLSSNFELDSLIPFETNIRQSISYAGQPTVKMARATMYSVLMTPDSLLKRSSLETSKAKLGNLKALFLVAFGTLVAARYTFLRDKPESFTRNRFEDLNLNAEGFYLPSPEELFRNDFNFPNSSLLTADSYLLNAIHVEPPWRFLMRRALLEFSVHGASILPTSRQTSGPITTSKVTATIGMRPDLRGPKAEDAPISLRFLV
ncbi:hypothetical protein K469DRAFT_751055 [Zopfia rhizophila CBS 207.26]|uniref:Uncharacterized protein n=1 Tax=Zopfia rhizophila CBS 207.26 TaxID=1314779 RepID=A0A6A6DY32_9PEZI|nr:hypothetical protein K469DRAFT_751055 [Zopfia rhizophila CBS 207.26]